MNILFGVNFIASMHLVSELDLPSVTIPERIGGKRGVSQICIVKARDASSPAMPDGDHRYHHGSNDLVVGDEAIASGSMNGGASALDCSSSLAAFDVAL